MVATAWRHGIPGSPRVAEEHLARVICTRSAAGTRAGTARCVLSKIIEGLHSHRHCVSALCHESLWWCRRYRSVKASTPGKRYRTDASRQGKGASERGGRAPG
jgi:hypothetical protein